MQGKNIIVLTKPPQVVYNSVKTKIGSPKDYIVNQKDGFKGLAAHEIADLIKIPEEVIKTHKLDDGDMS